MPTCLSLAYPRCNLCVSSIQALKTTQDSLKTRIEGLETRCPVSAGGRRAYTPCGVYIPDNPATVGTHVRHCRCFAHSHHSRCFFPACSLLFLTKRSRRSHFSRLRTRNRHYYLASESPLPHSLVSTLSAIVHGGLTLNMLVPR